MADKIKEELQWSGIRVKLNQAYKYDAVWEEAIQVFDNRLKERFFYPIQIIIDQGELKGEGFAMLTVQCALMETFAAFRLGKIFNHNRKAPASVHEYYASKNMFTSFLQDAEIFRNHFWTEVNGQKIILNPPFATDSFYSDVRCGLMHEARTKGNWLIRAAPKSMSVKNETQFIVAQSDMNIIYRTTLHYRLLHYFEIYKDDLRQNDQAGQLLRRNFARKLDHLFDFPANTAYEWWT
ncbi:hypothetical protein AAEO56_06960 [Flavobacterium sp. DGU11]|uniref:Uncharacterized protein n=1 Tax=Flavobacterium arundinis TaxID=3139143 RepID=A0ABU9HV12_9FLAO